MIKDVKQYQDQRVEAFDQISKRLDHLKALLASQKKKTITYYKAHPKSWAVFTPTDAINDCIDEMLNYLTNE